MPRTSSTYEYAATERLTPEVLAVVFPSAERIEILDDGGPRASVYRNDEVVWDAQILAIELQELSLLDLDFEIEATGFETAEIDLMLGDGLATPAGAGMPQDEAIPEPDPDRPAVTRPGEVWDLGKHWLICGDARDPATRSMATHIEEAADRLFEDMIEVDPPKFQVIYKDIALEDIRDPDFVEALREVMRQARVPTKELDRLFETGSAVSAKDSFRG